MLNFDRLENDFVEFKTPLNPQEATQEASRCIQCFDAPCIRACPTGINIPQFIHRIASEDLHGAAKTILDSNVLGLSCAVSCPTEVLCEGACVYNRLNHKPISIGKLQRKAVETAYQDGIQFYHPGPSTGKKVALIGAGPSSLGCAHELRKNGHETVIFEKSKWPGGLNTQGIAPYKMKAEISLREIEKVAQIGIEFRYEMELGRNLHLHQLLTEYDAVFLGMGLGPDSSFEFSKGKKSSHFSGNSSKILGAIEFIRQLKTAPKADLGWIDQIQTALVIGGGNTALDACRELKGLGIPKVILSYRRDESKMSGYPHELRWARQEGVECLFHTVPIQYDGVEVTFGKTKDQSQGSGLELTSEELRFPVDLILVAIGQAKLEKLLSDIPQLQFSKGRLSVNPDTGATGHPRIFAGGDLTNGGMEVVNAVAEGKKAALAIHAFLSQNEKSHNPTLAPHTLKDLQHV